MRKVTVSLIKADVGSVAGHTTVPDELKKVAEKSLQDAVDSGLIVDFRVFNAGDDLELLMTHTKGVDNEEIHRLAWETFEKAAEIAKEMKLYGAGQDLLKDAFSGNVRGLGPGVAEMEFTERKAEPLIAFMMDKTEPGAFNMPIFRIFADPFNTAGLVIDPSMHSGFVFEIWDIKESKRVFMRTPEEMYDILALIGGKSRFVIKRVYPKEGGKVPADEPVAVVSTEKLYEVAGEYVGKDDPVALVRAQSGLPAVGEVLEAFAFPHLVSGWMRGSHNGPIMPVPFKYSKCTRFDGPPRCIAAGFQIANGKLVGPVDMFDDPAFDYTRNKALEVAEYMRRHGPFEPHRLPSEDMEYTTLPKVLEKLKGRFEEV
ncbi:MULTISPECIES: fructose-1,6-bisphosphate aldolase/phosphatase [unclassified Archaeoglobus]|jgi:fructose 1,6-bisphosphate aldolase/phosphatase|uniref:fructose-1,6-bisphosphate aldolase/phosphatase n=1 Tax=unclassified Archaeoglobus TaxID=2643606 RepID=UPI0025C62765|nr:MULTISPECIES: fructose-1,6-bisphosphate aldolase/phosphatase [unclassified Archaeoglobus]